MRKIFYYSLITAALFTSAMSCKSDARHDASEATRIEAREENEEEEEKDGYDEVAERARFEFERIKDPKLGFVPMERMFKAIDYTEHLKAISPTGRTKALNWEERGPIFDSVGPSNGNIRGANRTSPGTYTSGRTRAILVDTLNDPSGNTVFCGGVDGGMWKCTNFLSQIPNWRPINDRFDNLAISYICQDPTNPAIMYFSTGEPTANADAVYGGGVYRSTDAGTSWTRLMSSANVIRSFRILCDAAGNVYLAARITTVPVANSAGLLRSTNRGDTWENITPNPLPNNSATCTDIEISSTGRLHASLGYNTGGTTTRVAHVFTTTPATVTASTWTVSTGIRSTGASAIRMELASQADTLYAATVNSSANLDSVYKSIDGGETWTKQNTAAPPTGVLSGQGWYNLTLSINPSNSNEIMIGGLDAYRSTNSGATFTRATFWVGPGVPYVHADHHFMQWWNVGSQSRLLIGGDGGIYLSNDAGATFTDKNRNLAIKQFYDAAIHPGQGVNYIIGGTQDNGTHQLRNPGLTHSIEVTGGDGAFVHINQQNPQIQFATYIYNQYRRSVNGGQTWTAVNLSSTMGAFINQYDYDGGKNTLYASWAGANNRQILRWRNAHVSNTDTSILTISALTTPNTGTNNNATAFKVSPYTRDRVFFGGNKGAVVRLDNANTVTNATMAANATNISGANFDSGYVSCVNTGSSDNVLVATFSSFGVRKVWVTTNGGTSWTNVDGNLGSQGLPDMPVRWAVFDPQNDNKLILATEAGVYTTEALNGANTVWTPDINFPTVRTDMLRIRQSDNTIVAATHGRGIYTAVLASTPEVRFNAPFVSYTEATTDTLGGCRRYRDYIVDVSMISAPTGDATVTYTLQGGNTAIEGSDFEFTTNGDFTNPSRQQVFSNGVMSTKTLTVRVYDDAEQEGDETFVITFNITGTTNAIAGNAKTFTITIADNDFAPALPTPITQNVTVGSLQYYLTFTNGSAPLDQRLSSRRSQFLYPASELLARGLRAGTINNFQLTMSHNSGVRGYSNFTVKMGTTTRRVLYDSGQAYVPVTTTTVKSPYTFTPVVNTNFAANTITLDAPYNWDGTSSLVVELCYNNATIDTSGIRDRTVGYDDTTLTTTRQSNFIWQNNIDCNEAFDASATNFSYFTGIKPLISFSNSYITTGTLAATALNTTKTEYFATGSSTNNVHYYTQTGEIMARFKNTSMLNYGCTEVVIDRAGTGVTKFYSETDSSMFLMNKTFRIIPTTNHATSSYEVTFYFSRAEKDMWEAITKQNFENIKVIKVPGQISSVTPSNPTGAGAVQVINPTSVGLIGNNYFITANVTGTLSGGFGFGLPFGILPVSSLTFNGKLQGDNTLLQWSTESEQNTKTFEVEKSLDGVSYRTIGSVKAAGNSRSKNTYSFLDREIAVDVNYYRLNVLDNDNASKKSNVVIIKNAKDKQGIFVINNPFSSYIDVRFAKVPQGRVKLQLLDANGKLIHAQAFNGVARNILRLDLSSLTIAKGVYVLSADVDGTRYAVKVMKR